MNETSILYKMKRHIVLDIMKTIGILIIVSLVGFLFQYLKFSEANIIIVYILGVLISAVITDGQIYSIVLSLISVVVFNFLFTQPRFTLHFYDSGYPVTFIIMFLAAFITSSLTVKIKQNARNSALVAYRTKILLETNQLLQKQENGKGITEVICLQLSKLLNRDIIFYPVVDHTLNEPLIYLCQYNHQVDDCLNEFEKKLAIESYLEKTDIKNNESKCLYLPIQVNEKVYGVVGIKIEDDSLDSFEHSIVLSILGEAGLAYESDYANKEKTKAEIRAKNEQLHANLLRSISHDLRTPLTSISGNANILISNSQSLDEEHKQEIYRNINDDSRWLINLVENLLSASRMEDGTMKLNFTTELIDEVVNEAVQFFQKQYVNRQIEYIVEEDFMLVKLDARLIIQVIDNLLDNAIKYTPVNSLIQVKVYKEDNQAVVEVIDNGVGVDDKMKKHIFEMFYTGNKMLADSRRSLGLGLALCKSIINAHEGMIDVLDHYPTGAIFKIILPIKEVTINGE